MKTVTEIVRRSDVPTGTVTFVATDMYEHRRLLRRGSDYYAAVMDEHDRLLRKAFAEKGCVVDVVGDSFLVAFRSPGDAVRAAAAARQALAVGDWPDGGQPAVHMGIHTGDAVRAGSRYFSVALIRTLQICKVATGGQVVLSQATESLLDARDLGELELRDLGERELSDFERPVRLYELVVPAPARATAPAVRITDA